MMEEDSLLPVCKICDFGKAHVIELQNGHTRAPFKDFNHSCLAPEVSKVSLIKNRE
jgi:hypothetical protein